MPKAATKLRQAHDLIVAMTSLGAPEIRQVMLRARAIGIAPETVRRARRAMPFIRTIFVNWRDGPGRYERDPAHTGPLVFERPARQVRCIECGHYIAKPLGRQLMHAHCRLRYYARKARERRNSARECQREQNPPA